MSPERPSLSELTDRCPDCGGSLEPDLLDMGHDADFDRCDCEEAAVSVAVEGIYSPLRDTREPIADSERFLPVKESA
jgi:hypothetical protein